MMNQVRRALQFYTPILASWFVLRGLSSLLMMMLSPLRPRTLLEQSLPLWPVRPTGEWLSRALVAPLMRWDAEWYRRIVMDGYQSQNGTAQFHPLYAWLSSIPFHLGLPADLSLLLVSSIAGLAFILLFMRLANLNDNEETVRISAWLLLCFPMSCVLFIPYTESLFLCLSVLCLLWARGQHWWLAGSAGALAALTRQQGVFLLLPIAWEWWHAVGYKLIDARGLPSHASTRDWLSALGAISLPLGGLIAWISYRAVWLSDLHPDLSSIHNLIYSVFISPSADQVVRIQTFTWKAPWLALRQFLDKPDVDLGVNMGLAVIFLVLFGLVWRFLRPGDRLLCLAMFVAGLAYYTGPEHPYEGLPRHLFLAFPIFLSLGQIVQRPWQRLLFTGVGLLTNAILLCLYSLQGWVI